MKMKAQELAKWEKERSRGALLYSIRLGTMATLLVLGLFIFSNGYENYDMLDAYIKYNFVDNALYTFTVSIMTYIGILILSFISYYINDVRYKKTIKDKQ